MRDKSQAVADLDRRNLLRHDLVVPLACLREGGNKPAALVPARINLGGNGIRFSTTIFSRVGHRVDILLGLPGGAPLRLTVKILQIRPDEGDEEGYIVSGEFVGMPLRIQERLIQFLLRAQASHLKETQEACPRPLKILAAGVEQGSE